MNMTIRILQADKTLLTVSDADARFFDEVISAADAFNPQLRNDDLFGPLLGFFEDPEEGQLGNTIRIDQRDVLRMFDALMWLQTHWTTEFQQLCYLRSAGFDSPRVRVSGYDLSDDYIDGQRQHLEWTSKIVTAFGAALNKHFTPIFITDDPDFELVVDEDNMVQTAKFAKEDEDEDEIDLDDLPDTHDNRYDLLRVMTRSNLLLIAEDMLLHPKNENRGELVSRIVELEHRQDVVGDIITYAEDHGITLGKVLSKEEREAQTKVALETLDDATLLRIAKALNMSTKSTRKTRIKNMLRYERHEILRAALSAGVLLTF